jgi:exodeoxyribonuclease VII small subunit
MTKDISNTSPELDFADQSKSSKIVAKSFEKKISKMSFEDALARLEEIVEILSSQKIDLNLMIDLHEEGSALKEHCSKRLEEAKMKIETISKKEKI